MLQDELQKIADEGSDGKLLDGGFALMLQVSCSGICVYIPSLIVGMCQGFNLLMICNQLHSSALLLATNLGLLHTLKPRLLMRNLCQQLCVVLLYYCGGIEGEYHTST